MPDKSHRVTGDPTPSAAELDRAEAVAGLIGALVRSGVDVTCYGYLRLRSVSGASARVGSRGERQLLLGDRMISAGGVTVIDWRTAPLSEVFFSCRPGDDYELDLGDREVAGTVLDRALIECRDGVLIAITADRSLPLPAGSARPGDPPAERTLRQNQDGAWQVAPAKAVRFALRDDQARARMTSPVLVPLDPVQRAAVDLPADRSLLVLGEAGFGKTTVALHRLATLARRAGYPARPYPMLILVPTGGLRRLYTRMLDSLGLGRIEVATCDEWLSGQARRLFRDLPKRDSGDASAAVIRIKRHPALRIVLPAIAAREVTLAPGRRQVPPNAIRDDLFHLFGDRALLEQVADAADGALTRRAIAEVIAHTKVQFSPTTEAAHDHVDADRLVTVDGAAIDAGTPLADANTLDVEDCAVLFEINRLRTGGDRTRAARLTRYRHIVLDEAQELSPLELAVVGRALAPGGVLTVAGDHHQQTDDTAVFGGWPATLRELGVADAETVTLEESYRCPPAVTELARALFAAAPAAPAPAPDNAVVWARFAAECHLHAALIDGLLGLKDADPRATVAVICHTAPAARALASSLCRGIDCRLSINGDIDLDPGIHVTCVEDVKGLEFDYVILPDADAAGYPDPARSTAGAGHAPAETRRHLYVAITRASHQLVLAATRSWSPLLATFRPRTERQPIE